MAVPLFLGNPIEARVAKLQFGFLLVKRARYFGMSTAINMGTAFVLG